MRNNNPESIVLFTLSSYVANSEHAEALLGKQRSSASVTTSIHAISKTTSRGSKRGQRTSITIVDRQAKRCIDEAAASDRRALRTNEL